ncbi:GNAT family N-acetyltransferase [Roseomonas sp. F4]
MMAMSHCKRRLTLIRDRQEAVADHFEPPKRTSLGASVTRTTSPERQVLAKAAGTGGPVAGPERPALLNSGATRTRSTCQGLMHDRERLMDAIQTERLILRNFRKADAAGLLAYLHEPRAGCFLSERLEDMAAAEAEAERRAASDQHVAVGLKGSETLIGDLFCFFEEPDTYSVGWNFSADFGGKGFALEAARALFTHLFETRQARRLYAYAEEDNAPSWRLCEKLGMRREGAFIEFISFGPDEKGEPIYENTLQYAVLRKEWNRSACQQHAR